MTYYNNTSCKRNIMSKIAISADIHFGVPGRTDDILWACRVMREYCKLVGIDTMLVLGDLYHNRQSIEIDVNSKAFKFFEQTKEEYQQNWIVFPGNHDMFLRHSWDINSLTPLRKHLQVIEDICILQINDTRFWVVPFITYEKTYMKVIKSITKHPQFRPNQDNLLTHIGVRSATLNTCFLIKDWSIVSFEDIPFHRIYTGHFHSKQQIGANVWYPGSPIPFKFDEGDIAHGFYVYDLEQDSHKFINIWKAGEKLFPNEQPPAQFITILDEDIESQTPADLQNNIVRVVLQKDYTSNQKSEIKQQLLQLNAKDIRWMDIYNKKQNNEEVTESPSILHNDLFANWLSSDTKNLKDLDLKVLNRCNQEVVHEGDELYTLESTDE